MTPHRLLASASALLLLAACTPYADAPLASGGSVTLRTDGDMGAATSRARLACGESRKTPVVMSVTGEGKDQVATFGCL
jgi:hypothetical protein